MNEKTNYSIMARNPDLGKNFFEDESNILGWYPIEDLKPENFNKVLIVSYGNSSNNYILKIMNKNEYEITNEMSKISFAPKILDAYEYDNNFIVISEKMDGNLLDLFFPIQDTGLIKSVINQVLYITYEMVVRYNIIHRDIKLANFVYRIEKDGKYRIYVIDFETSQRVRLQDKDLRNYLSDMMKFFRTSFYDRDIDHNIITERFDIERSKEEIERNNELFRKLMNEVITSDQWRGIYPQDLFREKKFGIFNYINN